MVVYGPGVAGWVYEALGGWTTEQSAGVGWMGKNGELIAALAMEGWNGSNAFVHYRQEGEAGRKFWYAMAEMCFVQYGLERITAPIVGSSESARRLTDHAGFEFEARLHGAGPDGVDLDFYVMWRDRCRFLSWGR
jgi:RimJ/RimL family protein N-acetyltransferase